MGRLSVDFPHLLGNAPGMTHSPEIHLLSGDWDMSTLPETSTPASVVQGTLGTSGGYSTLTPSPTLVGINPASYVVSRDGIPVAGGIDTRWAELVAHNTHPGDNLLYRGHAFLNTSSTPDDFFALMRGGHPANPVWGAYVQYSDTGLESFQIVSSNVGPAVVGAFASAVSSGDSLFTGINYATHQIVHQHNAESTLPGALLNLTGMPDDETFYQIVFLVFASGTVAFNAGQVSFLCGSSTNGRLPIQGSGEAVPPVGATDGREYKVTVGGSYRSYRTLPGDFAKFYNGMQDLQVTRLASRFTSPVYTVTDMAYDDLSDTLRLELSDGTFLETTITASPGIESMVFDTGAQELTTSLSDGSEIVVAIPTAAGFVAITDIEATDGGNVYGKVLSDGGHVVQSCTSSTTSLRVYVVAVTGSLAFKPSVLVNTVPATLTRYGSSDSWTGFADITLAGSTVTAVHGEGSTDTATVTVVAPPVVTSAALTNLYPGAPAQTKHAAGQSITLSISADQAYDLVEVLTDAGTATLAHSFAVASTTSSTHTVATANRGTSDVSLPAKVRVRNLAGTWSEVVVTSNSVLLNNTLPTCSLGSVSFLTGFQALAEGDGADVVFTSANADGYSFTSPTGELTITDPLSGVSPKRVTCNTGTTYNIATANLRAVAARAENGTTSSAAQTTVFIANTAAEVSLGGLAARLRSSPAGQAHVVTLTSTQRLAGPVTLDASVGTWSGAFSTADQGVHWTRTLLISDSDTKGAAVFSNLAAANLAGIPVAGLQAGTEDYVVGGFMKRVVQFLPSVSKFRAPIGTSVTNISKLLATNLSKGVAGSHNVSYSAVRVDDPLYGPFTYTVVNGSDVSTPSGSYVYNNDSLNANGNNAEAFPAEFEIEETV